MKLKKLLLIGLMASTINLSGCSQDGIYIGLECNYKPFNWTIDSETENSLKISGSNTYCTGYDIKIAKKIGEELNKKVIVKKLDWDGLIPALNTKVIDLIIAGMSPTEDRKEFINFSDPYYRSEQTIVVKSNGDYSNATKLSDFSGAIIGAQTLTFQDELASQMAQTIEGVTRATPLESYPLLINNLKLGVIDGFIAELPVAQSAVSSNPDLKIIRFAEGFGFNVADEEIDVSIGIRKSDTDLLEKVNSALSKISINTRNTWMEESVILSNV